MMTLSNIGTLLCAARFVISQRPDVDSGSIIVWKVIYALAPIVLCYMRQKANWNEYVRQIAAAEEKGNKGL